MDNKISNGVKILVFSPFYPPHIGGLEDYSHELNLLLSQNDLEINVFTPRLPRDTIKEEIFNDRLTVFRFPAVEIIHNYPLPSFWNLSFWKLFFSLFGKKYDLVISHTRFFNTSLLALFFSKIKKMPWIHIEHGSDYVKLQNKLASIIAVIVDKTQGKLILNQADKIIAVSQAAADFCKKLSPKSNPQVIYRGFQASDFQNFLEKSNNPLVENNILQIGYIGRLIDGKGVQDLISAIAKLKIPYKLHIIGDGSRMDDLKKQVLKFGLTDKIIFYGYLEKHKALTIINNCDILVNPSYTEGLPTSVIEAGFLKKAVIATNVGGTPEIMEDGASGFLINTHDPDTITEKIEILAKDGVLRNKFGEEAQKVVREKFTWENNIGKFITVIKLLSETYNYPKIYLISPKSGGAKNQHLLIAEELRKMGYKVQQYSSLWGWIRSHFIYGKNKYIITNLALLFRLSKKGLILNLHGNYRIERNIFKNPLGYLFDINRLWSEHIVVPIQYLKDELKIKEAIVIENAISNDIIRDRPRRGIKDKDEIIIAMVTMFSFWEKSIGALRVIESLARLRTNKKITFNIYGCGCYLDDIDKKSRQIKLPHNISYCFHGYKNNIHNEIERADIFAYWSNLDVMPIVLLEAMANALPIVANNFSSFKEFLGNNPLSSNQEEFAKNLNLLIKDNDYYERLSTDNIRTAKSYSIDNIINKWTRLMK